MYLICIRPCVAAAGPGCSASPISSSTHPVSGGACLIRDRAEIGRRDIPRPQGAEGTLPRCLATWPGTVPLR